MARVVKLLNALINDQLSIFAVRMDLEDSHEFRGHEERTQGIYIDRKFQYAVDDCTSTRDVVGSGIPRVWYTRFCSVEVDVEGRVPSIPRVGRSTIETSMKVEKTDSIS